MHKIIKKFTDYPFAHRQHNHDGHCKLVHGHNWTFDICVTAEELDENGFVYDFGKFKAFRKWLEQNFDHTCLINKDDPQLNLFKLLDNQGIIDLVEVESGSAEGLAKMIYETAQEYTTDPKMRERGVQIAYVVVREDETNMAQYTGE